MAGAAAAAAGPPSPRPRPQRPPPTGRWHWQPGAVRLAAAASHHLDRHSARDCRGGAQPGHHGCVRRALRLATGTAAAGLRLRVRGTGGDRDRTSLLSSRSLRHAGQPPRQPRRLRLSVAGHWQRRSNSGRPSLAGPSGSGYPDLRPHPVTPTPGWHRSPATS